MRSNRIETWREPEGRASDSVVQPRPRMRALRIAPCLALALAACAGDAPDLGPSARDGGVRDAGFRDAGFERPSCGDGICEDPERFVTCPADCPPGPHCSHGVEGCPCSSSFALGDDEFALDDCMDADNVCVAWDLISGRGRDIMLPAQTCVKRCTRDSDCGRTREGEPRYCVNMDVPGVPARVGSICVDRIAELDEPCGASVNVSIHTIAVGARVRTPNEQVGCPRDTVCLYNAADTFEPDEGVCVQPCGRPDDARCEDAHPFCNPVALEIGTATAGVCGQRLGFGAWSLSTEDEPRFTSLCDRGGPARLRALSLEGINLPIGLCIEDCNEGGTDPDQPCVSTDPTNPVVCRVLDASTGDGVCVHSGVDLDLDTCAGRGVHDLGRVGFGVVFGDQRIAANWCVDRLPDPLRPALVDTTGAIVIRGDDCKAAPLDLFRCPEPSLCSGARECVAPCVLGGPATDCQDALMTLGQASSSAVCVAAGTSTVVGVCGG